MGLFAFRIGVVAALLVLCGLGFAVLRRIPDTQQRIAQDSALATCIQGALKEAGLSQPDIGNQWAFQALCVSRLSDERLMDDFRLRRLVYLQQDFAGDVVLWVVVVITVSGVVLAAIQLVATYQLAMLGKAEFAQSGQLDLESGKLAFKSSVTGLFILLISFAFFLVFIRDVYTIKADAPEQRREPAMSAPSRAELPDLGKGGLGPPPAASPAPPQPQ